MNSLTNTQFCNLKNVIDIARGEETKFLKYLKQFQLLVTDRIQLLNENLKLENRSEINRILHQTKPQLQFFNVKGVRPILDKLELEYESIPIPELTLAVNQIIVHMNSALKEIEMIIENNSL